MLIKKLIYDNEKKEWTDKITTYDEYLKLLQPKERKSKNEC